MSYTVLKFVSYGFAWIAPIVILVGVSRWMRGRSVAAPKRKAVLSVLVPFVWVCGLVCSFVGHYFHEAGWWMRHPEGIRTEEDMLALGDYPNVFAGWIMLGWIPVLVGLLLSKRTGKN